MKNNPPGKLLRIHATDEVDAVILDAANGRSRAVGLAVLAEAWPGRARAMAPTAWSSGGEVAFFLSHEDKRTLLAAGAGRASDGLRAVLAAWRNAQAAEKRAGPIRSRIARAVRAEQAAGQPRRFPGETVQAFVKRMTRFREGLPWGFYDSKKPPATGQAGGAPAG